MINVFVPDREKKRKKRTGERNSKITCRSAVFGDYMYVITSHLSQDKAYRGPSHFLQYGIINDLRWKADKRTADLI